MKQRNLESLVLGNTHARFGEGRLETCPASGNAPTAYSTPESVGLKV